MYKFIKRLIVGKKDYKYNEKIRRKIKFELKMKFYNFINFYYSEELNSNI